IYNGSPHRCNHDAIQVVQTAHDAEQKDIEPCPACYVVCVDEWYRIGLPHNVTKLVTWVLPQLRRYIQYSLRNGIDVLVLAFYITFEPVLSKKIPHYTDPPVRAYQIKPTQVFESKFHPPLGFYPSPEGLLVGYICSSSRFQACTLPPVV